MKKTLLIVASLAALSTAAFADRVRSYDLTDSPEARGTIAVPGDSINTGSTIVSPLMQVQGGEWMTGKYGLTKDPAEVRRWSEKNGG